MTEPVKPTIIAATCVGLLCGLAAVVVLAIWWAVGPNTVSCYYATYSEDDLRQFGDMVAKMWPTRWVWVGLIVAPTITGALLGGAAARFGFRLTRGVR
ncbi:hypothetical protein [Nocardia donostiensis]|uniref:Uncharacterized protein n=1 Tax=Nocardia donostiensis TaxID=1538463 RepID=A0A1V2TDR1_9NOCA|nr:hypothetical protein [Nocardia donostiensis]ONM47634.1 hypothetical protein B0T46_17230 [Nocardia donostiensis]OQS15021.1 hypothetical protein B0T36_10070 [Nocardia donostiensis]OQS24194.1 hypothetical protein B0T44_00805 [Nocardia donostiensis]